MPEIDERGWVHVQGENLQVRSTEGGIQMRVHNAVSGGFLQKFFPQPVADDLANTLIELAKEAQADG